jgi:hypothetical protein
LGSINFFLEIVAALDRYHGLDRRPTRLTLPSVRGFRPPSLETTCVGRTDRRPSADLLPTPLAWKMRSEAPRNAGRKRKIVRE